MEALYRVAIKGVKEGFSVDQVVATLAPTFKVPEQVVRQKFATGNFVVKKSVDVQTAKKYQVFLEQKGCYCAVEPENGEAVAASSESDTTATVPPAGKVVAQADAAAVSPAPVVAPAKPVSKPVLVSTAAKPELPRQSDTAVRNASADPQRDHAFLGKFNLREALNMGVRKRYPLYGKGELRFHQDSLRIVGKRHRSFWFGADDNLLISYADILDANSSGRTLRFTVEGLEGENKDICFVAATAVDAQKVMELLPQRKSDEFRQFQQDTDSFNQSLESVGTQPYVTYLVVLINIAIFIAMAANGAGFWVANAEVAIDWGTNYGPLSLTGQWWRLFTACFIHFGFLHLAMNMLALFMVGRMVERLYGSLHYLILYVFAGLSGSVVSMLWHPTINSAGASGAIFGIFGAMLAYMLFENNGVPQSIMVKHRNSMLGFIGYSLFNGFTHSGIDNGAHLGGLIGGFVMGFMLMRPLDESRNQNIAPKLFASGVVGVLLLGFASYPLFHPSEKVRLELAFQNNLKDFIKDEARVLGEFKTEVGSFKDLKISQFDVLEFLEKRTLPQWQAINTKMSSAILDPRSKQYQLEQRLLEYIASRQKYFELMIQAIRYNDKASADAAIAMNKEVDAKLQEIKRTVAK